MNCRTGRVAVDAAVVRRRRDDPPDAVVAALDVQERVADRVLLQLDLAGVFVRWPGPAPVGLYAVLEERARVLVVDEEDALVGLVPSSGKNARKSLL